jgi:hypothetical protein
MMLTLATIRTIELTEISLDISEVIQIETIESAEVEIKKENCPGPLETPKSEHHEDDEEKVLVHCQAACDQRDAVGKEKPPSLTPPLQEIAPSVKVQKLPNLPETGHVSDRLEAGGTSKQLIGRTAALTRVQRQVGVVLLRKKNPTPSNCQAPASGTSPAVSPMRTRGSHWSNPCYPMRR